MKPSFRVVFYDKKNRGEVNSEDLMPINFVRQSVVVEDERDVETGGPFYSEDIVMGNIGYKADKADKYRNFDRYCMESDLVFIRFEEMVYDSDKGEEGDKDKDGEYICHCRGDKFCIFCGKEID